MNTQKTGEFIKALRKENHLTQAELAQKLNCTDKAISRWETGKGLPDADMLLSLSDQFGVSINEILLGERFSFAVTQSTPEAPIQDNRIIEEIISSTDETIVEILKDKEEEIGRINRSAVFLTACCCMQFLLFSVPVELGDLFGIDGMYIFLLGSLLNYTLAGFIKDKCKWIFPFFATLLWFFTNDYPGMMVSYAFHFGVPSFIIMGIVSGVRYLIKRSKQEKAQ